MELLNIARSMFGAANEHVLMSGVFVGLPCIYVMLAENSICFSLFFFLFCTIRFMSFVGLGYVWNRISYSEFHVSYSVGLVTCADEVCRPLL